MKKLEMDNNNLITSKQVSDIPIEACHLHSGLNDVLIKKLRNEMIGKCSSANGYIINIPRLIRILENIISSANSIVILKIEYEVEYLLPKIGDVMSGRVCMVFQHGVLIEIEDKIQVLIPISNMGEYKYDNELSIFKKENEENIKMDDNISVRFSMVKYEDKEFSCIGELG